MFYAAGAILLLLCRKVRAVARRAFLGRWFVEKYGLALDGASQLVAPFAANILVRPFQRKPSPLVMVEQ